MATLSAKKWAMAAVLACGLAAGGVGVWQANAQEKPAANDVDKAKERLSTLKKVLVANDPAIKAAEDDLKKLEAEAQLKRFDAVKAEQALKQAEADAVAAAAKLDARKAERLSAAPEFKYVKVGAVYAPTTEEFEKAVKDGESGGWTFVGVMSVAATTEKNPKGSTQALVFRRTPTAHVTHETDAMRLWTKRTTEPPAPSDEEKKLMAQIERLTKELHDMKGKEKAFRGDVVFFPMDYLKCKPGEEDNAAKVVTGLLRLKDGNDWAKNVTVLGDAKGVTVTGANAAGNESVRWLSEQVKKLRDGQPGK